VDPKNTLRNIQANRGNFNGGLLLSLWRIATTTLRHIDTGEQGPSTPSSSSALARQFLYLDVSGASNFRLWTSAAVGARGGLFASVMVTTTERASSWIASRGTGSE
jgi:hypothetical protein